MIDLVRIIYPSGSASLNFLSFSQVTELLKDLTPEQRKVYAKGVESVILPDGTSVKLCDPDKLGIRY